MPALHVLLDAPAQGTREVQIAKTGTFKDPRYGTFTITLRDFSKWIANFQELHRSEGREGLPVDVDHRPEKSGDTEAVGWITSLSIKSNELWASVEWNSVGKELVADRRYKYLSPTYVHNYKDEHGKEHGTALVGVALTNRPFLTMATVNLSQAAFAEETYTQEKMPDLTKIAQALKLDGSADEATILAKAVELVSAKDTTPVSLEDQAKAEGKFVLSADNFASLSQQASEGAAAAKTLAKMTFETKFDKCLSECKVAPAQKDIYSAMYDKDPENTIKLMDSLQPIVNAAPKGSSEGGDEAVTMSSVKAEAGGHALEESNVKLHERTLKVMAEQSIENYGDALVIAADEMGVS
jgi:phage I-like protein